MTLMTQFILINQSKYTVYICFFISSGVVDLNQTDNSLNWFELDFLNHKLLLSPWNENWYCVHWWLV